MIMCHTTVDHAKITFYSHSAVEYSPAAMLKSVRILEVWRAFLANAEAYVQGQLRCQPINEPYLMKRYEIPSSLYTVSTNFLTPIPDFLSLFYPSLLMN